MATPQQSAPAVDYFKEASMADKEIIEGIGTTNGFVVDRLLEAWPEFRLAATKSRIEKLNVEKLCPANFMRLVFVFSSEQMLSVMLKTSMCILGQKMMSKELIDEQNKALYQEVEFYRMFGHERKIKGFPLPKIYYSSEFARDEEANVLPIMILENLPINTCGIGNFDEKQVKVVAIHLAEFHKHLMCLENEDWKTGFKKMPFFELETILQQKRALDDKEKGLLGGLIDKLRCAFSDQLLNHMYKKYILGLPLVIVHGFLNPRTVLFSSSDPSRVDVFLFLNVSLGSIARDLERMIFMAFENTDASFGGGGCGSSSAGISKEMEMDFLALYYDALTDKMRAANGRAIGFTFDELMGAYRFCKLVAVFHMLQEYEAMLNPLFLKSAQTEEIQSNLVKYTKNQEQSLIAIITEAIEILEEEENNFTE